MAQAAPPHIESGEALRAATTIVDVRTAAEFAKGAVAGAVNIPLFDNSERAEIGTIYKQIGKQEAIQAGIMYAFIDSVRGMLERISKSLDEHPFVVATGGWSPFLNEHLDAIDHVDPHLVLHGIRVLMMLNDA